MWFHNGGDVPTEGSTSNGESRTYKAARFSLNLAGPPRKQVKLEIRLFSQHKPFYRQNCHDFVSWKQILLTVALIDIYSNGLCASNSIKGSFHRSKMKCETNKMWAQREACPGWLHKHTKTISMSSLKPIYQSNIYLCFNGRPFQSFFFHTTFEFKKIYIFF